MEGLVENIWFHFLFIMHLGEVAVVSKWSKKKQLPHFLGHIVCSPDMMDADLPPFHVRMFPVTAAKALLRCSTVGKSDCSSSATRAAFGGLVSTPQPVTLAHQNSQTQCEWVGVPLEQGRGSPWTSVQACCGHNRRVQDCLGYHVQQARSMGSWAGPRLQCHINCLKLLVILLALRRFQSLIQGKHVFVRTDNTAAKVVSCCTAHVATHPHLLNRAADTLLQNTLQREWRLHPKAIQLIWSRFSEDLFASQESTHCRLWYSLTEDLLGSDTFAHS